MEQEPTMYGASYKRRKFDDQAVGDFIVKALNVVHFKIGKFSFF